MSQAPPPLVTIDPNAQTFGSPDEAADAVSKNFVDPDNRDKGEQIAVIVKRPDGKFVASTAAAPANHDNSALRIGLPKGHTLAAIVHSHPGNDDLGQTFSNSDISTANQLKVPSFIRFAKDGSIRKYTPGKTNKFQYTGSTPSGGTEQLYAAHGDPIEVPPAPAPSTADASAQPLPLGQSQDITVQAQRASSQDTDDSDEHDAQDIPVIDRREAANRVRSGGADASGKLAGPAMVDTRTPGDSSSAQTAAPADKWEARLQSLGPDLPPEDPQAAAAYTAKNPVPSSSQAPVQKPPLNKWEARLQSLGPDLPPPPASPAPAPPARSPSYLSAFGRGAKGVAEQGRQLLSLLGYTLMPWGASASEGGDVQAQEDLSADPTQQAQKDTYFQNVVDPATRAIQDAELRPDATFGEKLSHGLGATAAMIAEAIVTGGGSLGATTAETAVGRVAQRAASGAAAMSVPAAQNAVDTGRRVLEATGDKRAAVIAGVTSYATTAAQGAVPMGIGGKILTRMASGAGIGVAAGEANRVVSNATMPDSMQQPFDIQTDALNAITGSLFGLLPGHESAPPRLADRRAKFDVQEQLTTMMDHAQEAAADTVARQGGDKLSQVVAATDVNATLGAHYHAGEYEGHVATRHAQVAEEAAAQDALDAETARTAAFNQAQTKTAGAPSADDAFAARDRQQAQSKDQDFTAARNQKADQDIGQATEESDTLNAGIEKGGAEEPKPTIADALSPGTLQALKSLQERRAAEAGKATPNDSPSAVQARIAASTPDGEGFQKLPPNARGAEPAPAPANRLAAIRQAAQKAQAAKASAGPDFTGAMRDLESQPGEKVSIADLREEMPEVSKEDFDKALLAKAKAGDLQLHSNSRTARASLADRRNMVPDGNGGFFDRVSQKPTEDTANVSNDLQGGKQREADTRNEQQPNLRVVGLNEGKVPPTDSSGLPVVRGKGDQGASGVDGEFRSLSERRGAEAKSAAHTGSEGQQRSLRAEERALVDPEGASEQPKGQSAADLRGRNEVAAGVGGAEGPQVHDDLLSTQSRVASRKSADDTAADIQAAARESAYHPDSGLERPTEAQYHAGNYPKGHVRYKGMDVSIEHPAGS